MNAELQRKPPEYTPDREERVAAALRDNLRKRKAQQQAKAEKTAEGED